MCARLKFRNGQQERQLVLNKGTDIAFVNNKGEQARGTFQGYLREERWSDYWKDRTEKVHTVNVTGFSERNTMGKKPDELADFQTKGVLGVLMAESRGQFRLITTKARAGVEKVHHRMPRLVPADFEAKKG